MNPGRLPGRLAQFERHRGAARGEHDDFNDIIKPGTGQHYYSKTCRSGNAMIYLEPVAKRVAPGMDDNEALSRALEDANDDEWLRRLLRKQVSKSKAVKVRPSRN